MKYEEVDYIQDGKAITINVRDCTSQKLKDMEEEGVFICPFSGCEAELCLVHNSKNGGRTFFFKAVDDKHHIGKCDYKIENYKETSVKVNENGIFTEGQVNASVRSLYNDYTQPLIPEDKDEKKKKKNSKRSDNKESSSGDNVQTRKTSSTGRIVYGDEGIEGVKGRMRRRYQITSDDYGQMAKVCGAISEIYRNQHGEMFIKFKDERLNNIQVFLGPVYEQYNPTEYERLSLVEEYYNRESKEKDVILAAGGLVNNHNNLLILELQAKGSFVMDGKTIMRLIIDKTKEKYQ